jgi:broad specificity phosphatase PhoE
MYLVRHGQTEWNAGMKVQGQTDSPLTPKGLRQAEEVAQNLKEIQFAAIYSSDLLRAQRTATIIKLDRELEIKTSEYLRERSYGRFEGMSFEEYQVFVDEHLKQIEHLNEEERWNYKKAPDVESDAELVGRFMTYLREIALAHNGETVLVVSHAGTLRAFLRKLDYLPEIYGQAGALPNCACIEVESDGITFEVKKVVGLREVK